MKRRFQHAPSRAVILLEVLLAVAIFGMAAVALVQVINGIAETSLESKFEMRVMNQMESLLEENGKAPNLRSGKIETPVDDQGVAYLVEVGPVSLRAAQGIELGDLFLVRVVARWKEGSNSRELTAENFRYAPMYQ